MAILTDAGLALIAAKQAAEENLSIDQFVLANIDGLDPETTPPGTEVMPDPGDIVHQAAVTQAGYVNPNTVIYSLLLSTAIGDFNFNWIGLYSSSEDVLVAVNYIPLQTKKQTTGGLMGNTLTKNFAVQFANATDLTGIVISAETWQIDFTARVKQIDERERLSNFDLYGTKYFFGTGFLVVDTGGNVYEVSAGICYIDGIRLEESLATAVGDPGTLPTDIYIDAVLDGDITGREAAWSIQISQTTLNHYVDGANQQHYVERIATINGDGSITDRRADGTGGLLSDGVTQADLDALSAAHDVDISKVKDLCFSNANQILKMMVEKYAGSDSVIETFQDADDIDGSSTGQHDSETQLYKTTGSEKLVSTDYDFIVSSQFAILMQSKLEPTVAADIDGNIDNISFTELGQVDNIKELDDSGVPASGLIHEWLMRDATPTEIPDSAGTSDLVIAGTLEDDPGPHGAMPAKNFKVANSAVAESDWYPAADGFTLLVWAKSNDGQNYMFSTSYGETKDAFTFNCSGSSISLTVNKSGTAGSSSFSYDMSSNPISNGDWHLYGFYINGTSVDLILDGVKVASGTLSDGWTWTTGTTYPFRLGTKDWDGSVADLNHSIGDIRAYNRQLTTQELLDIYEVFVDVPIKAFIGESTEEGSTIQLDVQDAEAIDKYTIFAMN